MIRNLQAGQPLPAAWLMELRRMVAEQIIGRDGITVSQMGNGRVVIGLATALFGRRRGGGNACAVVDTYADLVALTGASNGATGYTLDLGNYYVVKAGVWRVVGVFEQATAPYGIGETAGDRWECTTTGVGYKLNRTLDYWLPVDHVAAKVAVEAPE